MTLPDKLTAAEFERLKAQEQRMLNSGSWVPQAEDRLTAQVNAAAADSAAPDSMTAEQADVAEAQQSVMAETQFGRSVGIRPDYSQPPAKDPAEDEPKTINDLRKRQQDLYNDPSYDMPFEEWQDFTRWKKQNESEVGSFISGIPGMAESLGQLGVGLVKERAQQLYRATAGLDPIGAAATEVATFKEMGRKIGVGLTQLSDWVGGKVSDIVESGRRVGQVQQNVIQALRDNGQLTGDPIQDNTTIQKALKEAAAQGMYEPTQQQAEEDDEVGYQRYQRKKAYDREYSGITQFSIGGSRMSLPDVRETVTMPTLLPNTQQSKGVNAERQVFQPQEATSTVGAMAFSPENALPVGIGVLARARMVRRLASITGTPLKATETAMASIDDWMARTADRVTSKIPIVGDLPLRQRAYTLGAAGGVGAYLDATTDSPVIDVVAKPLIFAGAVLPTAKLFGGTLRRVGAGAGAGWQVIKEMDAGAVGSARAETAARMAASGKFNPRYSQYMERGAQGGVESTLRRVSNNPEMPETLRRIARSADNIGITQVARGIDDAVSSSVAAGIAATPFALAAPDSETAGGIVGGAVLLGGTLGTAGRVIGRRSARTDADIARMMVDVEMAGGDAGSLGALSYSGLDLLAAMQGITSGKVDFVPLRAQEYRANADVRASGGETVAGLHIEKAADGRAKVYVNMGHTAPIAGRVSIKPIQITRNGKTEDANVVRIKGEDGQSDFTVVPREYPLLVKSGDIVEPNARLARGLSPTHVMPHEIGHAILTSGILNGTIRDDLRNLVNQRYDTAGVEARGREYVTRIVDKDILAGAHDQLPDKLTQQEFDDIANGRRTMADVLKGKPVSDTQREAMINDRYNEMRERSIADGNNPDGLDVFRDEIVAETFSSLSDSLDFRRMRAGGPQVMESVLAATARVFETMGVKFDRSTGKLMDNPSVVFRDNPLMQDPIMRKRMQEHLRNYEAWMLGMEQAGAREQKGTQISVDGSAESARRSTHTKLRANDNGVLENDLIYIDQNGQAQWKPQKMLDEQEKGRSAQVGQLYDKNKILPPNSAEFGLRRAGAGRTVISGPTLPAKFDVLRWFPKHIREMARMVEAGREGGASHIFDYNTIGTGEGGRYRVINRGDVRAIIREGAFLGWEATKNGHLKAVVMDLNAFRSAAMRAINRGELGIFNNDMSQLQADLMVYLANHKNGLPGEATIGQQKRDMLNGLIGTGTAVQRDINPLYADLNPRGSVRSFRFDRINDITPTGRDGYHFDYDKLKHNRMPQALPREAMAMPNAPANLTTDQILRELEENQGYLGLSTLGMREGRPVKGGAQQTRELLKRNTALNEELRRRGGPQEESDVERVLRQRGQAMPDVTDRRAVQQEAKRLGLPATGTTKEIADLVGIATKDPYTWSREEFDSIAPYLSIHQDIREGSDARVAQTMSQGLSSGMVDSVGAWRDGRMTWSGGKMAGNNAYLFISGGLKYRKGNLNPWLDEGNMPIAHLRTRTGQTDIYESLQQGAATGRTRGQAMPDVGDVSIGLPRRSMESRGGAKIDEDGTVTFQGREPKDWAPEDFAKFGKEFGVRNLGPLSKVSNIVDELGRPMAQIPGGLDGKFTYYDLLWLKANPVDVKSLPVELHGKLTAKLARTMTPERGNDVQKFNGILFGMLSPNSPLLPNEFGQARMRFESMDGIRRFASLLPDNPTKEQRKAVNQKLKKELGFTSAKSGGLGIGISVDLSNIVMAAKMFVKKPDFFIKKPNESWANFVDKLTTQVGGLGTKTASFGGVWQDPLMAGISAMDRHMARAFSEELLNNPEIRGRFEGMVVKRFNDLTAKSKKTAQKADAKIRRAKTEKARAKAIEDKQDAMQNLPDPTALKAETLDDVLGQAEIFGADRIKDFVNEAVFAAMGSRKAKYLVKGGAVNPKLPESLQGVEWVEQPKDFQVMSDAYRLALEINAKRAKEIGIEVFPSQWTLWDRIRGRVEPHEAMFPGLEKLPALNDRQLAAAYAANKQAGYARNVKAGQEWKRKSGLSPSSLAYFTPAVLAAGAAASATEEQ